MESGRRWWLPKGEGKEKSSWEAGEVVAEPEMGGGGGGDEGGFGFGLDSS
jgi:hypothetical protein